MTHLVVCSVGVLAAMHVGKAGGGPFPGRIKNAISRRILCSAVRAMIVVVVAGGGGVGVSWRVRVDESGSGKAGVGRM